MRDPVSNMEHLISLLSLCLLLPAAISGGKEPEVFWKRVPGQEYITKLTSGDIEEFVNSSGNSFIMFYAHWCPASEESKEEFASVAQELHYIEGVHVSLGALDCNTTVTHLNACRSVNVTRYPRFLYFTDGSIKSPKEYKPSCPRDRDYFYNWILHKRKDNYCSSASSLNYTVNDHVLLVFMVFLFLQKCFMIS